MSKPKFNKSKLDLSGGEYSGCYFENATIKMNASTMFWDCRFVNCKFIKRGFQRKRFNNCAFN